MKMTLRIRESILIELLTEGETPKPEIDEGVPADRSWVISDIKTSREHGVDYVVIEFKTADHDTHQSRNLLIRRNRRRGGNDDND